MDTFDLRTYLQEGKLFENIMACPLPTQDLELNTANRNRAIQAEFIKYGPLNLADEAYWVTNRKDVLSYALIVAFDVLYVLPVGSSCQE